MKIEKKHAVALHVFIWHYLDKGYYPVDDTVDESALISKVLGFGLHHELSDLDFWKEVNIESIPKPKKVARIDLTEGEACAILDMMGEGIGKDIDDLPQFKSLNKYLRKVFINEDNSESTE